MGNDLRWADRLQTRTSNDGWTLVSEVFDPMNGIVYDRMEYPNAPQRHVPTSFVRSQDAQLDRVLGGGKLTRITARNTWTVIGDSRAAYGDNTQSGGSGVGDSGMSILAWCSAQLVGSPMRIIANRAVPSTLIDSNANNATLQFIAGVTDASDCLWITTGLNNFSAGLDASLPSGDTMLARTKRLLDIASPMKSLVVVDSITPINMLATVTPNAPRRVEFYEYNLRLKALCSQYNNVVYNDIYSVLALDSQGNADPRFFLAADGVHQNSWGAYVAGKKSALTLQQNVNFLSAFKLSKYVSVPDLSGTTGTKTPGTGTITGTVATGMALSVGSGSAAVTATAAGNAQRMQVDNTANATTTLVTLAFAASAVGSLTTGDIVTANTGIVCAGQRGLLQVNPRMYITAGTQQNVDMLSKAVQETLNGNAPVYAPVFSGQFSSRPWTLTGVPTNMQVLVNIEVAAGGFADITVSGLSYYGVTAQ